MNFFILIYILHIYLFLLNESCVFILMGRINIFMDEPSSIIDLKDYRAKYKFKITAIKGPAPV